MEKLVLIDGNSLINRAFYAMPLLTTKNGIYTNAVYGFMNMFIKMLAEIKPTYCAVAFDVHAPTFRHNMFKEYKGTRKPMAEELRPQIPLLKEVLSIMNIKYFEQAGIEADDIIGTIAKHTDVKTVIFTGDRDSFQLVDKNTEIHFTRRGISDVDVFTNENFIEKTSITPSQIIELKALMGDASDNIPGVSGIGEKTALSLLHEYNTVDEIYKNTDKLTGKIQEKIVNGKESAYLSKTLATININCDIDCDLEKMRVPEFFSGEVKKKFVELEFKSLYNKDELFNLNSDSVDIKTEKVQTEKVLELSKLSKIVKENTVIIKTVNSINLYNGEKEYVIEIAKSLIDLGFPLGDVIKELTPILNGNIKLIFFNVKEFRTFLFNSANIEFTCPFEDLSILKYLTDFTGTENSLQDVLTEYDYPADTPAFGVYNIYNRLFKKLFEYDMEKLYYDIELPLSTVLFSMEKDGFKVDVEKLNETGKKYQAELLETEKRIKSYADEENLNLNSPKQLGDVLFEKLKVGKGKKTKTGYSTTADVLEAIADNHPIIPLILRYRQIQKLQSTYIDGLKPLIDGNTGLIHTSFNQTTTSTGRLSSKEPNLQNIPVRDDEGKELRKFFVPRDDNHILISADYSQIELRLLAAFSNSKPLINAFVKGVDIHSATAERLFGVSHDGVTDEMRRKAKAVNFGVIYGISEYGLAKNIKVSPVEAKNYINSYFNEYPEVKKYMDLNVKSAKETGYAVTVLNRRRYIRELTAQNFALKQFGERAAMNMPLQGSAADVIKLAMLGVYKRLIKENLKSKLILQIHDELIIDTVCSEKEQVEKLLKEEMENALPLSVPLTVNMGVGKTWYEAK